MLFVYWIVFVSGAIAKLSNEKVPTFGVEYL